MCGENDGPASNCFQRTPLAPREDGALVVLKTSPSRRRVPRPLAEREEYLVPEGRPPVARRREPLESIGEMIRSPGRGDRGFVCFLASSHFGAGSGKLYFANHEA